MSKVTKHRHFHWIHLIAVFILGGYFVLSKVNLVSALTKETFILSFMQLYLFGIFFAGGWTPCIGPIVGSVLFLAANMGSMIKATTLLIVYGLGVVIPLIIVSLIADKYDITKYIQGKSREIKLLLRICMLF